jgi:hypothetical protein
MTFLKLPFGWWALLMKRWKRPRVSEADNGYIQIRSCYG